MYSKSTIIFPCFLTIDGDRCYTVVNVPLIKDTCTTLSCILMAHDPQLTDREKNFCNLSLQLDALPWIVTYYTVHSQLFGLICLILFTVTNGIKIKHFFFKVKIMYPISRENHNTIFFPNNFINIPYTNLFNKLKLVLCL